VLQSNLLWWRRYQARAHLLGLKLKVCDRASAQNTRTPAIASQNVVSQISRGQHPHHLSTRSPRNCMPILFVHHTAVLKRVLCCDAFDQSSTKPCARPCLYKVNIWRPLGLRPFSHSCCPGLPNARSDHLTVSCLCLRPACLRICRVAKNRSCTKSICRILCEFAKLRGECRQF